MFLAGCKDIVRVGEDCGTELSERQATTSLTEKLTPKRRFETAQLTCHRWSRQLQLVGRCRDGSLMGDRSEVVKVVIVQPLHLPAPVAIFYVLAR